MDITIERELVIEVILQNSSGESVCRYIEEEYNATDLHTTQALRRFMIDEVTDCDLEELLKRLA